eukprot:TRINITY_DN9145_c0_g1_i1.p1 TRINITY_DN9145_c0_g1~~TRINITY_DN9145_c0_g1_i1.p1  ORF type:complete len:132 (-),score=14.31 TRINITY_DN9145_c0_g1_i1:46-441(-)
MCIRDRDEETLNDTYETYLNRTFYGFFGTLAGVIITDKLVLPRVAPNFRIKHFRGLLFLGKYALAPLVGFKITRDYFCRDVDRTFRSMAEKYNFNMDHYNRAIDTLQTLAVAARTYSRRPLWSVLQSRPKC